MYFYFKVCGGLTAHKGARHGLRQSGKLSRVEQQDKILSARLSLSNSNSQISISKMYATAFENSHCPDIKRVTLDSDQESDDEELVEKALFSHEYSRKGKSKKKTHKKVEASLVAGIDSLLTLSEGNALIVPTNQEKYNGLVMASTSSNLKSKKHHGKKIKCKDVKTEKSLLILNGNLETSASSTKTSLLKSRKRKILSSDSEEDQNDREANTHIDVINERVEFLHDLMKYKPEENFKSEHNLPSFKKNKTKRKRLAKKMKKKYKKLADQFAKNLDILD